MERVMAELAGYFCSKVESEVHMVLYGRRPEIFYPVPDNLTIHKPSFEFNNDLRLIATVRRMLFLRSKIKEVNPTSILSFGELWNSFVLLALLGLKYPVFISDRCSPTRRFSVPQRLLRKALYPTTNGIISQSEKAKQLYVSMFGHKNICVIGNPIRRITPLGSDIKKENIILTVGRLIETKNHDKLIEIFHNLSFPDWRLIIIGGDALNQANYRKLDDLIRRLNENDRIELTGNLPDVDKYYLKSKLFVFTSSSEGFPNVIGEAMSAGLPVVAFDCVAGPSEMIVDGENGFLIPLFDYSLMQQKMIELMISPEIRDRIGNEAIRSINKFSVEEIGEKYYTFITATN